MYNVLEKCLRAKNEKVNMMKRIVKLTVVSCLILIIGVLALTSCEELLGAPIGPDASDHVHTVAVDKAVSPTCTEDGLTGGKHCSVCNEVLVKQDVLPAYGHKESTDNGYAPTCTTPGLTDGTRCSICSQVIIAQESIDALGHTEVIDQAVEATCTEDGLTVGKHCSVCDTVIVAQRVILAGHKVVVDPAVEPTCTEDGFTEGKHCSACDTVIVAQETLPAGHKFGEWETTIEPTEESEGLKARACAGCEAVETETLAMLEHDHERWAATVSEGKAATCTEDGYTAGKVCTKCGETYSISTRIPATGHSHGAVVTAPTCTEGGYTTHTCHCGDRYVDSHVDATGHNRVAAPAVAPTCTKTGLTAGEKCANCGEIYVAQETVDALGHVEETIPGKAPTCIDRGLTDGKHCTRCNRDTVSRQPIAALGHDEVSHAGQAPTCTEAGWHPYSTCTRCDYSSYLARKALGHVEAIDVYVAATCTTDGITEGKHCTRCNATLIAQNVIKAPGHDYKVPTTANYSGICLAQCTVCKAYNFEQDVLRYSDYGATGDDATDDAEAIRRTHNAANYLKLPVEGESGAIYYIGNLTQTITIKTSTNWNGAHFIFDDSQIMWNDKTLREVYVFTISQDANYQYRTITVPAALKTNGLKAGQTKIDGLNLKGPAMLLIENSNQRIFKRYGVNSDSGDAMQEMICVDQDGNVIGTPIQYDYSTVTSIKAYSVSEDPIFVGNANIVTKVPDPKAQDSDYENNYCFFNRGIRVQRSNTTLYDIVHTIEGEQFSVIVDRDGDGKTGDADPDGDGLPEKWTGDKSYGVPYSGFFGFEYSYNVLFTNCKVQGHQAYNFYQGTTSGSRNEMGSYDIYAKYCVGLQMVGIKQRENYGDANGKYTGDTVITNRFMYHGIMGSYYCRNIVMDDCYLDRFDSHKGMHNATITDSTLGFGILVIGGGTLHIENVYRISEGAFILLREDYSSVFDGDIEIINCKMGSGITNIIAGRYYTDYHCGLTNYLARNITIDGLETESGYNTKIYIYSIGSTTTGMGESNPLQDLESVRVRNVYRKTVLGGTSSVNVYASRNSVYSNMTITTSWTTPSCRCDEDD